MDRKKNLYIIIAIFVLSLVIGSIALAQTGGVFTLRQFTMDNGGGSSSGGTFVVRGTAGQADAGRASGDSFTLEGGFWHNTGPRLIYLPISVR